MTKKQVMKKIKEIVEVNMLKDLYNRCINYTGDNVK